VAGFLGIQPTETIKTLIVEGNEHPLIALILRGDDELNEIKAAKHPLIKFPLRFADEPTILSSLGAPVGSLGPVNLSIPIIADHHALALTSFVCGANEAEFHFKHACWGRDAHCTEAFDLRNVKEGDRSPDQKGHLKMCRGIEVGHVFQLGDKYAKAMNASVLNEEGKQQIMLMGCYGLGITRVVAAAIEQHHDDRGILWPMALAPFQLVLIPINGHKCEAVNAATDTIYQQCLNLGIDVLLDDRRERPGVLFADNDLIGIPHRLVISERNLNEGLLEYKARHEEQPSMIAIADCLAWLKNMFCSHQ
jgi:prolyl-tRNA synthetase